MIDFLSFVVFMIAGMFLGTLCGLAFMKWQWHGDSETKKTWLTLLLTFVMSMFGASR